MLTYLREEDFVHFKDQNESTEQTQVNNFPTISDQISNSSRNWFDRKCSKTEHKKFVVLLSLRTLVVYVCAVHIVHTMYILCIT